MPQPSHILVPAAAALIALAGIASAGAHHASAQPPANRPTRLADDLAVIRTSTADAAARAQTLRRLFASTDIATQRAVLDLLDLNAQDETQTFVLRELSATPVAPQWVAGALRRLAQEGSVEQRLRAITALGSVRTREAVGILIGIVRPEANAPVAQRDAAFVALARLTGRSDFSTDPARWQEWFARVEFLPEFEWRQALADGLADGADRMARDREASLVRLLELNRLRYSELPSGDARWTFLAALLHDEFTRMRRLGVSLANTELANARVPGAPVAAAAIDLLRDPYPDLRRAGAELIDALAAREGAPVLLAALQVEADDAAAASMLTAVKRWPSSSLRPVVLHWAARSGSARKAAVDAASALYDQQLLTLPDDADVLLRALREIGPASLSPAGMRLLVNIGTTEDRRRLTELLNAPTAATRAQTADALSVRPDSLDALIVAARSDPSLFIATTSALGRFRPSVDGYRLAAALPAPNPEVRRDALASVAAKLAPADLLAVARAEPDAPLREAMLTRIQASVASPQQPPIDRELAAEALVLLARTRMELRQPAAAIEAIEVLSTVPGAGNLESARMIRGTALVWLNRLDDAQAADAPLAAWLDGLERAIALPHARDVARRIHDSFGNALPAVDASRLADLEKRIPREPSATVESSPATPPPKPPPG